MLKNKERKRSKSRWWHNDHYPVLSNYKLPSKFILIMHRFSQAQGHRERIESLLCHVGCPQPLFSVVKKVKNYYYYDQMWIFIVYLFVYNQQTNLSDGAIHRKYIEFKNIYPVGFVRKQQLTTLLVERYISVLTITSDSEKEDVKQMLYKDESLMSTVDRIIDITTNSHGSWAFLGFREVRLRQLVVFTI